MKTSLRAASVFLGLILPVLSGHAAAPKEASGPVRIEDPGFGHPADNFERLQLPAYDVSFPARLTHFSDKEKARQRTDGSRIQRKLLANVTASARSYTIPPGIYRFPSGSIPVDLTDVKEFAVQARGVEFILEGTQPAVHLKRCRDVSVSGITVDRDPFPYTQFEVVEFDPATKRLEARFMEGYDPGAVNLPKGDLQFFTRDGRWVGNQVFIHYTSFRVTDSAERLMVFEGVETYEPTPWMVAGVLGATVLPGGIHHIETIDCSEITVEDFTAYGGSQIIFGERGAGEFTFRRIKNITRPGTNRLIAGGFGLMTWISGNMRLEESVFSRSNDDALDMVSWNSIVFRQETPDRIIARAMCDQPFRVGDTLQFHDRTTFNLLGSPKIVAVERIANPAMSADAADLARTKAGYIGNWDKFDCVRLILDGPVEAKPGDTIANETSFRLDSFTLKNCLFFDIFCRVLVHGLKEGLIEGNVILRSGLSSICVDNEQQDWAEGPCSRNVVIRNNVIKDSPCSPYMNYGSQMSGAISVGFQQYSKPDAVPNTEQSTYNITIEGNRIINPMYAGILVKNTDGVRIADNVIVNPVTKVATVHKDTDPGQNYYRSPQNAAIFLFACRNVSLERNTVEDRGPYCTREVAQMPGLE